MRVYFVKIGPVAYIHSEIGLFAVSYQKLNYYVVIS